MATSSGTSRRDLCLAALSLGIGDSAQAQTETFPTKPVRLIVPAAPGGVQDVRSRQLAEKLVAQWHQQVLVDNRPGGAGDIALENLLRAPADGYTMAMGPVGTLVISPHLMKFRFDPLRDLAPVTLVSMGPLMLLANPQSPIDSVATLVRLARESPGRLNVGGYGTGGPGHLAVEQLNREAKVQLRHIPYTPGLQPVTDLIGGQIPLLFEYPGAIAAHVRSGRIRALATAGRQRLALLPEVPTFTELGLLIVNTGRQGIVVKAGTPRPIIDTLHQAVSKALAAADLREAFAAAGVDVMGDGPEAFGAFIRAEYELWGKLIKDAGIRLEQ